MRRRKRRRKARKRRLRMKWSKMRNTMRRV
jgi:hypothetical protein